MNIALRCRCGKLQGEVESKGIAARISCYCEDCQAYARFLDKHPDFLDAAGGTDVAATLPAALRFTQGLEHLACMSLGPKGIFRWYAACCRTPIGATPRNVKMAYVGLVRASLALSNEELDRQLGPPRAVVNTESASRPVASTPARTAWAIVKVGSMIATARINGRYKTNPFFDASGTPVKRAQVLSLAERIALGDATP